MCVAIAQPIGTHTLTIEELEAGWKGNPDGGGFAYIDENGMIQDVHSMDKDSFILQYLEAHTTYGATSPFLVHMRIATHGSVNVENTHPFRIDLRGEGEMMFMHNGIISKMDDAVKDLDITDTLGLAKFVLNGMYDGWLDNEYLVAYIEDFIDWSKLVFLSTSPATEHKLYILNEDMGVWDDGVWHSNYSCFATVTRKGEAKKPSNGRQQQYSYDTWDDGWGYSSTHYENGVEVHHGVDMHGGGQTESFNDWLIDPAERRFDSMDMNMATHEDHIDMLNESIIAGDACPVCTGKARCLCDDTCGACYEFYHECQCDGDFKSLTDSFGEQWGARVTAIANGESASRAEKAKAELEAPF